MCAIHEHLTYKRCWEESIMLSHTAGIISVWLWAKMKSTLCHLVPHSTRLYHVCSFFWKGQFGGLKLMQFIVLECCFKKRSWVLYLHIYIYIYICLGLFYVDFSLLPMLIHRTWSTRASAGSGVKGQTVKHSVWMRCRKAFRFVRCVLGPFARKTVVRDLPAKSIWICFFSSPVLFNVAAARILQTLLACSCWHVHANHIILSHPFYW